MSLSQVLLVNPNQMKPAVVPLALDYLASALEEQGIKTEVLDLCFSSDIARDIKDYFSRTSPSLVAITLRNTDDTYFASQDFFLPRLKEITDLIKTLCPAPIVLGGAGFSLMPQAILNYCELELGIWGEGEHSLPLLVKRILSRQSYEDIPALVFRQGKTFRSNPPEFINLRHRPAPRRGAADNRRYFNEGGMGAIESKRGCSKGCIYCADPLSKGRKVRLRSPASVVEEIESLLEQGIDHFHFCDSELNLPPHHATALCQEIVKRGLGSKIRWYAYCSPAPFNKEMARLFLQAGCAGVNFGVDSACDPMLHTLGRDFTAGDLEATARICHEEGIVFLYDLLLGGPGETRDSLRQTIETMKRLSPSRIGAALGVRLLPGTRLAALVRKEAPLEQNPNLHGVIHNNEGLLSPVFYLSSALGAEPLSYLHKLVAGDERFFLGSTEVAGKNYNYNDNSVLVEAIKNGYRGAFWDILRRLQEKT